MSSEIMAKDKIQEILEKIAGEFPLGDFYLPDGIAPVPCSNVHILPYDRLLIVLEGVKNEAMSIHGELRIMKLKKGDFFLVRKNMWENASFNEIHEILCIIPQGSFLRIAHHFVMVPNASNPWDRVDWFHTAVISDSILHAFTLLASVENSKYAAVIVRLIASLAIDDMQKELPYSRKAQMTFENIRNFIEFHFNEPLTRNEIAKYFNLNHCYVSQLFKKFSNSTLLDYITSCRISKAKFMLINTMLPIKSIAEHCGFQNEVYFIRRFREVTGFPPGRYRLENSGSDVCGRL